MNGAVEADQTGVTSVFKKLPWHTNVLAHLDSPEAVPKELESYCTVLASGFERQTGPNRLELKSFFQGQMETIPPTPLFDFPFTPYNRAQTSSLAISYRLLDVYACDKSPPINNASFEKYGFKDPLHIGFKLLLNWGTLVVNSSDLLEGAVNHALPPDDRPQTPSIRTYRHFIALCRTQAGGQNIIPQANFESAALHLSYLLEGNVDLPDSPESFLNTMRSRNPTGAGPIGKSFRNYNMQKLRAPLQTALAISPLCLIGNVNLNRATPGRPALCQVWQALGSSRPESLKWAESQLWELLWEYALQKIELLPNLQRTLKRIATRVSESIPTSELTWFAPLPYTAPPKALSKHELKNLRLTPPPTYSESDSDVSHNGAFGDINSTTAPPTPPAKQQKRRAKATHDDHPVDAEETSTEHGADEDMDVDQPRRSTTANLTRKRKQPMSTKRKVYNRSKSKPEVQTPSTQTRPLLHRGSVMPPYVEIIDLSRENQLAHAPLLGPVVGYQKIIGKVTHKLYAPTEGLPALYTPQSHLKEDVERLTHIVKSAELFYVNGQPRFMVDPPNSNFYVVSEEHFRRLTDQTVQDILKTRQIVITERQHPIHGFDVDGLETLTGLEQPISVYDQSIPLQDDNVRLRKGNLLDLYTSAGSSHGKSLIALELPMPCASAPPKSFASDIKAWSTTLGRSDLGHEFPVRSTKWGHAATAGSYHMWRIHRDGFSTYVDPQVGRQCWVVARPKQLNGWDEAFWKDFGRMRKYTTVEGSSEEPDAAFWDFEAILLKPGTRLILRPNTPHLAIIPEPSICHGGRFYSTSTILESCYGVFHTFLFNPTVDTQHSIDSRKILRRMLIYYHGILTTDNPTVRERNDAHIPQVNTFKGVLDLLTLCNIIELGNILTPKLYTDKDKCNRERHELIEARRVSRTVVDWLFDHYQLSLNGSLVPKSRQTLYWPYLAHQAKTLLWYMQQLEQDIPPRYPHQTPCTYEAVKHAIRSCFRTVVPFWTAWDACQETQSFAWPGPHFDVVTREPTAGHRDHDGKTVDDQIWLGDSDDNSDLDDSFSKNMDSGDERSKKKARHN